MRWSRSEIDRLLPILEQVSFDLSPVDGKSILVLCCTTGEVAFWLGEMMESGNVTGLDLDLGALDIARRSAHELGLERVVKFQPAEMDHIPLPDGIFDGLVSDFIIYPTSIPTQISQTEMARILKPGGRMILADVIVTRPLPASVRQELATIGLDYLCEATQVDFQHWMVEAGLTRVEIVDLTPVVRMVWEARRAADFSSIRKPGYAYLLEDPETRLGNAVFYIYVRGVKPNSPSMG